MRIGIPRESRPGETLVAGTAKTASQFAALGYDVVVERGAGEATDQPDPTYAEAGVAVGSADEVWSSDVVVKVNAPTDALGCWVVMLRGWVAGRRRGRTVRSRRSPRARPLGGAA